MPYQPLESGKKRVSAIQVCRTFAEDQVILGLMTFGPDKDAGARVTDIHQFKSVLDLFQREGYGEVDTAFSYVDGKQQAFTREAGWKARGLRIATKFYPSEQHGGHTASNIRARCEENLRELGADSTDIFYLHAADRNTNFAETLEEVNELYEEGKFKQLGISNFASYEVAECVMICNERGWVRPTIYQGMYNAISMF
jgi:aflatoxin B1 aldehyde reductase